MVAACPSCSAEVLDIDVRCKACGTALGSSGAQRMIGQVVLGQYELLDVLGQGGMSVVYKGRHRITDQIVALKVLPPELAAHSQVKSRFLDEAKALAQLDHPNIVHLYNFGQENGSFVLAMQFVEGKTWERLIVESQMLPWPVTARLAVDVARALEYAHGRGIVHRDMKPSNVLVRALDGSATVMDFGIAKMTTSSRLTATGQTMGTVRYMSPEQVRGQEVDFSTDLYSLGATMYESLTGETPFDGSTHFEIMSKHLSDLPLPPSRLAAAIPRELEQVVLRCLSKRPSDRSSSAREVRKLLEQLLREQDTGLLDTQKLSRDVSVDVGSGPSVGPRTAASSNTQARPIPSMRRDAVASRRVRPRIRIVAVGLLATVVVAVAAVALLRTPQANRPWQPEIGQLAQQKAFPELGLISIRTPASILPEAVAASYAEAWNAFREYLKDKGLDQLPSQPVHSIVVVPRAALCVASTYTGVVPPLACGEAVHAFRTVDNTLVVVDNPDEWSRAMRLGVPEAACAAAGPESRLCELAPDFVPTKE
jgi:serine/threonine protein kinase